MLQDLTFAVRGFLKDRKIAIVLVLTLALGFGANTAVFTIVDAVLGRPLPVHAPSGLVNVYATDERNSQASFRLLPVSYLNYRDLREQARAFSGLAVFLSHTATLTGHGEPRRISVQLVSEDYFSVLGVTALHGRPFTDDEAADSGGGLPVAILSFQAWRSLFAADPTAIGSRLRLDALPYTVIGVMPPGFKGIDSLASAEQIWLPLAHSTQILTGQLRDFVKTRRGLFLGAVGRLQPGTSAAQADAEVATIAARLAKEYPASNRGRGMTVTSTAAAALGINQRGQVVRAGAVLVTVVGFVLLIACVNLASVLLARGMSRRREMGIRAALGASHRQLVRQVLSECLVLAIAGGVFGLILGRWLLNVGWSLRPPSLPADAVDISLNPRVLGFTFLLVVLATVLVGVVPALRLTRLEPRDVLRQGGRGIAGAGGRVPWPEVLVVTETALALVVVICAGLFVRSLQQARAIDVGFDAEQMFVMAFDVGSQRYDAARARQFYELALARAGAAPGVEAAALASNPPFGRATVARTVSLEGRPAGEGEPPLMANITVASAGYFETLRLPLRRGRVFDAFDREEAMRVAVVNETAARRFWPDEVTLGRRFTLLGDKTVRQVVGVVADSVQFEMGEEPQPVIFLPVAQTHTPYACLYVRTSGVPGAAIAAVRRAVQQLDPQLAITDTGTMTEHIGRNLWARQAGAALLSGFAVLALALAAVGTYGVTSHLVSSRIPEVAIRIALGASRSDIWSLMLRRGAGLTALGVAAGLLLSVLVARAAGSLLYGIDSVDPPTFAAGLVVLATVGLAASIVPGRRAMRVDPVVQLKE